MARRAPVPAPDSTKRATTTPGTVTAITVRVGGVQVGSTITKSGIIDLPAISGAVAASQAEVNAGLVGDKFVSPETLAAWPGGGGGGGGGNSYDPSGW